MKTKKLIVLALLGILLLPIVACGGGGNGRELSSLSSAQVESLVTEYIYSKIDSLPCAEGRVHIYEKQIEVEEYNQQMHFTPSYDSGIWTVQHVMGVFMVDDETGLVTPSQDAWNAIQGKMIAGNRICGQ